MSKLLLVNESFFWQTFDVDVLSYKEENNVFDSHLSNFAPAFDELPAAPIGGLCLFDWLKQHCFDHSHSDKRHVAYPYQCPGRFAAVDLSGACVAPSARSSLVA